MHSTNLAPYLNHSTKRLMLAIAYIDFVFRASANYLITITLFFKGCSVFFQYNNTENTLKKNVRINSLTKTDQYIFSRDILTQKIGSYEEFCHPAQ